MSRHAFEAKRPKTTVMLRNLPNNYTRLKSGQKLANRRHSCLMLFVAVVVCIISTVSNWRGISISICCYYYDY